MSERKQQGHQRHQAEQTSDDEQWMLARKCQGHQLHQPEQASVANQCHQTEQTSAINPSRPAAASVLVHRIAVAIEEDVAFGVVNRLLGPGDENFKYIAMESGVTKLSLNGKGSPHPQPRSLEQEPLTVCIRAQTSKSLEKAIAWVEDLLKDIHRDHQDFKDRKVHRLP